MSGFGASSGGRLLSDVISVFRSRAFVLAASAFTGIILARVLGPDGKGALTALLVIPSLVISLCDLGVRQAAVVSIGQKSVPAGEVVAALGWIFLLTTGIGAGVSALYLGYLADQRYTVSMIAIAVAIVPFAIAKSYASGVFLGKEQIRSFNATRWMPALIKLAGAVTLVWLLGFGVGGALVGRLAATALTCAYAVWLVYQIVPFSLRLDLSLVVRLVRIGMVYALALFILNLNYRLDVVMLERLSTLEQIGQYSVGVRLSELVWELPAALGVIIFSRSANAEDPRAFAEKVLVMARLALIVAACGALGLALVAPLVIPLLYGEAFSPSVPMVNWLLPGIVAFTLFKIFYMDLAGKRKPWLPVCIVGPGVALNVLLNLWLIPAYGGVGAAAASSASYCLSAAALIAMYSRIYGFPLWSIFMFRRSDFTVILDRLPGRMRALTRRWPSAARQSPVAGSGGGA